MLRCLVVGGNGFLGSYIVDELHRSGVQVGVFDRFSTPNSRYVVPRVKIHVGDFLDDRAAANAMRGYDIVLHSLSATTPLTAAADPLLDVRENVMGSVRLIDAAARAEVRHLYFLSSGGTVYGTVATGRSSEDTPLAPISPYGIGKMAIESYLEFYRVTRGLDYTIFRVSNAYGPRQQPQRAQGLIPIMLSNVLRGRSSTIYGEGAMIRDYIHARDVASQIVAPVLREHHHKVYNVGSGVPTSVNDVIAAVEAVTGQRVEVRHVPTPPTYVSRAVLDVSRFHHEFGSPPAMSLDQGIHDTWLGLREQEPERLAK